MARKVTRQDFSLREGGRVGPEFDGHSLWVDPQNPSDVAFAPTGGKGSAVVAGVFSAICGVAAGVALVGALIAGVFSAG